MQKKNILLLCLSALLLCGMASCQDPIYSEPPVYGKLKFTTDDPATITLGRQGEVNTSSICNPGDSVTVFMQVEYSGAYITEADYQWRLCVNSDSVVSKTIRVIAPHKQNQPPMWRFKAPSEGGGYTVTFKANYDYSAQTEMGTIYGESSQSSAELNVRK